MRSPFTPYGYRELVLFGGGLILLSALVPLFLPWPLLLVPAALAAFVLSFFRDPERAAPIEADVLAAPADGTVTDIEAVESPEFLGEPATRVGIFLSVFNVHVNRSPVAAWCVTRTIDRARSWTRVTRVPRRRTRRTASASRWDR
ncbi:MAG: phosphatidylserine decarboxylase [Planctomycetota bacterium]